MDNPLVRSKSSLLRILDWVFLLWPPILIPLWVLVAAGLGVGRWLHNPDLFWDISANAWVLSVFAGMTLIGGAAFILAQITQLNDPARKVYLSVLEQGNIAPEVARRLGWGCLAAGLILVIPGGLLALTAALAFAALWGGLYGLYPRLWQGRPVVETIIHMAAGLVLFYAGWSLSDATLTDSLGLAVPYILVVGAIAPLTMLYADTHILKEAEEPGRLTRIVTIGVTSVLMVSAVILGYGNGDPVVSTAAILALPFYAVMVIYRRRVDVLRTFRYSILIFAIFTSVRFPLLFIPITITFYLSRFYYVQRFGRIYPVFHVEHDADT